jgi:NAD(P)-dependent dehydrogenase (short-subunit alcohol dehydrogenase family)
VTVSSDSHFAGRLHWEDIQMIRHYNGLRTYEQSKLANVLFTHELNRRLSAGSSLRAFAADPGLVKTDIGLKGTPVVIQRIWRLRRAGGISPEQSAGDIVHLLTAQGVSDRCAIYWKHGKPARPSPRALDTAAASRLWSLSTQMCGLE